MNNNSKNLGILKLACIRLQRLKHYERKYKCTLAKEACSRLLVKYAKGLQRFDDLSESTKNNIRYRTNWTGWWGNPIGRWLRKFFETERHKQDLIQLLLSKEFVGRPKKMREYIANTYGISDKAEQDKIIAQVNKYNKQLRGAAHAGANEEDSLLARGKREAFDEYWDSRARLDKDFYDEYGFAPPSSGKSTGNKRGKRKPRTQEERMREAYARVGLPYHASDYLTDSQMYYDPGWMRHVYNAYGIAPDEAGAVIHNHYYSTSPSSKESTPSEPPKADSIIDTKFLSTGKEPDTKHTAIIDPSMSSTVSLPSLTITEDLSKKEKAMPISIDIDKLPKADKDTDDTSSLDLYLNPYLNDPLEPTPIEDRGKAEESVLDASTVADDVGLPGIGSIVRRYGGPVGRFYDKHKAWVDPALQWIGDRWNGGSSSDYRSSIEVPK